MVYPLFLGKTASRNFTRFRSADYRHPARNGDGRKKDADSAGVFLIFEWRIR